MATDYAALVTALYAELGGWQLVADACANEKRYAPMHYWKIARGQIARPGAKARRGIVSASRKHLVADITGLNAPLERARPGGLTCRRPLWLKLRELKTRRNWTWDDLLERALELLSYDDLTRC